ncbi:protein kinase [Leifsonia sp. TF02-11]|uniref:serine/threonine-protein kinase n=1 Tax=Leifsonia sp. TF02-11 TaxID=2815212 RepID=UPI0027DCCFB9|nr:protein kinase [Leifsonia sp. TF02-11]
MLPDTVLLDRYELREPLGRGGMATVYRAHDRELGRSVAIKMFAPGQAGDDARRRGEATALARLSHPNLVGLHDAHLSADDDPAPSYLVMELVEGEDLGTRLDRGPLPGREVAAIAAGVAEALVVVHAAGIVHRDLKPANILLAESEVPGAMPHAKLTDFGIAHLMGAERVTTAGTIIGTAGFLSPEQATGAEPGPAADVYSLGLVVLEALTGVREYPGTPVEAVTARLVRDPRIPGSLPEDWRGLIGAMTARDPRVRPTALEVAVMARELAPQLDGWVATGAVAVPDEGEAPTVALPQAVLPAAVPAPSRRPRNRGRASRRRYLGDGVLLVSGATAVVALALSVGSILAPEAPAARSEPTHRPTPTVTAPPQTVEPAETTQPPLPAAPAQQVQAPPAPQKGDNPNKGPGKDNGSGSGKGKGKGKG